MAVLAAAASSAFAGEDMIIDNSANNAPVYRYAPQPVAPPPPVVYLPPPPPVRVVFAPAYGYCRRPVRTFAYYRYHRNYCPPGGWR